MKRGFKLLTPVVIIVVLIILGFIMEKTTSQIPTAAATMQLSKLDPISNWSLLVLILGIAMAIAFVGDKKSVACDNADDDHIQDRTNDLFGLAENHFQVGDYESMKMCINSLNSIYKNLP